MTLPAPLIDHVIINARDALDEAADRWRRLGFQLTPRGHHTLGSSNNLAILGNDYIELLGVMPGLAGRTDVLDWPEGLNGLALKTLDSDGLYRVLDAAGVGALPPQAFSRPVDMGDGRVGDAAFRTVRLPPHALAAGRMFFCHHLTPELVWHDPWRLHPNGAIGLAGMVIAAEEPEEVGALFASLFGEAAVRHPLGQVVLPAGLATIEVLRPDDLAARFDSPIPRHPGRSQAMAALVVRTVSLSRTAAALRTGGIEAVMRDRQIVVGMDEAGGLILVFQE